jgi:hypothetical protein
MISIPDTLVAIGIALLLGFAGGYGLHWYQTRISDAKVEAKQEVVTTTTTAAVQATDTSAVTRLTASLAASRARATALQSQLAEAAHAQPADPVCALPIGLRDQINADLAAPTR